MTGQFTYYTLAFSLTVCAFALRASADDELLDAVLDQNAAALKHYSRIRYHISVTRSGVSLTSNNEATVFQYDGALRLDGHVSTSADPDGVQYLYVENADYAAIRSPGTVNIHQWLNEGPFQVQARAHKVSDPLRPRDVFKRVCGFEGRSHLSELRRKWGNKAVWKLDKQVTASGSEMYMVSSTLGVTVCEYFIDPSKNFLVVGSKAYLDGNLHGTCDFEWAEEQDPPIPLAMREIIFRKDGTQDWIEESEITEVSLPPEPDDRSFTLESMEPGEKESLFRFGQGEKPEHLTHIGGGSFVPSDLATVGDRPRPRDETKPVLAIGSSEEARTISGFPFRFATYACTLFVIAAAWLFLRRFPITRKGG